MLKWKFKKTKNKNNLWIGSKGNFWQIWQKNVGLCTYDSKDERVGEVSVEGELHHVPPQPQKLHGLSQTHKDVMAQSRNINNSANKATRCLHSKFMTVYTIHFQAMRNFLMIIECVKKHKTMREPVFYSFHRSWPQLCQCTLFHFLKNSSQTFLPFS